ncbi:hypothetical protein [Arthrobacter monumenti]
MIRHPVPLKTPPEHPRQAKDITRVEELLRRRDENLVRSAAALSEVLAHVEVGMEATPAVARSLQATENRWRAMEREFGMLDSGGVAELLGSSPTNRNRAHALAKEGRILGVKRGRKVLFPGFQFNHEAGEVREVIAELAEIGRTAGWEERHLLQWMCTPNGYLDGDRPVDHIEDADRLISAARSDLAERW